MRERPTALWQNFFRSVARCLWEERRCAACSGIFRSKVPGEERHFCPACADSLQRRVLGYCPRCGEPAVWPSLPPAPCARCLTTPPLWNSFLFHSVHEGLLRQLLHRLKFQEQLLLGHALGSLLARHPSLQELRVDAVVPVPLHDARLAQRGYNQALELARPVAAALGRPLEPRRLIRTRNTPPQRGKGKDGRRENILRAFAGVHHPARGPRGKNLLLLDDIMTTGATLADATRALLEAGAETVHVAVVSRTARCGVVTRAFLP